MSRNIARLNCPEFRGLLRIRALSRLSYAVLKQSRARQQAAPRIFDTLTFKRVPAGSSSPPNKKIAHLFTGFPLPLAPNLKSIP
jgi:hypothetical protein